MLLYIKLRNRFKKDSAAHCRFPGEFCFDLYLSFYGLEDSGFDSWQEQETSFFHFHISLKPALETTKSHIQWMPGVVSLAVKQPEL
jgi:hypothetical protein